MQSHRTTSRDDPTLHLPRLLCFHGGGTNSRIFRTQCRALARALESHLRFCYVEAPYISHPGPDVAQIFGDMGPFKAWLRWKEEESTSSHLQAVTRLRAAIRAAMDEDDNSGATGEWLGLLGFSQGAKICASILYTQQHCREAIGGSFLDLPRFRFAVLLAGRPPLVWLNADPSVPPGLVDATTLSTAPLTDMPSIPTQNRLNLPTLHVHGLNDPGLPLHRKLLHQCCDSDSVKVLEWNGSHRVPIKPDDVAALVHEILLLVEDSP